MAKEDIVFRWIIASVLCITMLPCTTIVAATGGPDAYGYKWNDGTPYHWIEISTTGQEVVFSGTNVSSITPGFGIGSPVVLGHPFTFYGLTYTQLVPAVNGYISTSPSDGGLDASNDCPLPAVPSQGGGARIMPFHDALMLHSNSAGLYYQYFDTSPHPYARCGVSVFTWKDVAFTNAPTIPIDFQALLFDSGDILFNIDSGGQVLGLSVTIGLQNHNATTSITWNCNQPGVISGDRSIVFESPVSTNAGLTNAIANVPSGGKIWMQGADLEGPVTYTINRPMSLMAQIPSLTNLPGQSALTKDVRFVVDGASVLFADFFFRDTAGDTIRVINGGTVKLLDSTIVGSQGNAIEATTSSRVSVVRSVIEAPAPGSGDLIRLDHSTLRLVESVLADSMASGINITYETAVPANPQLVLLNSAVLRSEEHGVTASRSRVQVRSSTISDNLGIGLNVFRTAALVLENSAIVDNLEGIVLTDTTTGVVTRTILARNMTRDAQTPRDVVISNSVVTSGGYNLLGSTNGSFSAIGDVVAAEPRLTPIGPYGPMIGCRRVRGQIYCHMLLAGSAAIEGGGITNAPAGLPLDVRGLPRVANGDNTGAALLDIGPVEAGTFISVNTLVDENNGIGVGAGTSLREAAASTNGTHVRFTNTLNGGVIALGSLMGLGQGVFVDASMLTNGITLSGGRAGPGFWHGVSFTGMTAHVMQNFQVTVLSSCVMANNRSTADSPVQGLLPDSGGAIMNADLLHATDCRFTGNRTDPAVSAARGGVINTEAVIAAGQLESRATTILIGCVFEKNQSLGGGGAITLHPESRRLRVDRCEFDGNFTDGNGGAIDISLNPQYLSRAEIIRSTFSENTAANNGGAIYSTSSGVGGNALLVRHSTLHGNGAVIGRGGGLQVGIAGARLDHVTITDNYAENGGGGLWIGTNSHATVLNTILDNNLVVTSNALAIGNLGVANGGVFTSAGYNMSHAYIAELSHVADLNGAAVDLGPLMNNGGPTRTRSPLLSSDAIDAGSTIIPGSDQRGFTGRVGARTDIGAVEAPQALIVTTASDEFNTPSGAALSLREAIRDAQPYQWIRFNTVAMTTNVINLATGQNTQLAIDKSLTVDASDTPRGITVSGPSAARCLNLADGTNAVALHGVSFRNGNASLNGGAIRKGSGVSLYLTRSAIYYNQAASGGGMLLLSGPAYLENVTLAGNIASVTGGAIFAQTGASLDLRHCTIFGNESDFGAAGVDLDSGATATLQYTVLAENILPSTLVSNLATETTGSVTSLGLNFFDDGPQAWQIASDDYGNPLLGNISDGGGLAWVCPPLELSPLLDAGLPNLWSTVTTDARGFPRIYGGKIDIGAMESGSYDLGGLDSDLDGMPDDWETLNNLNPNNNLDAGLDGDSDGINNLGEYISQTNPTNSASVLKITSLVRDQAGAFVDVTWRSVPFVNYSIVHAATPGTSLMFHASTSAGSIQTSLTYRITSPALVNTNQLTIGIRVP